MNRKFHNEVLRLRPHWGAVAELFYYKPVGLILHGFACDRTSGGAYITRFAEPLFCRIDFISLTFGDRLPYPNDLLRIEKGKELSAASEFIARVIPYETELAQLGVPENFLKYIEGMNAFRNPWVRRAYAMTLAMVGSDEEAIAQIQLLLHDPSTDSLDKTFKEDLLLLGDGLANHPTSARQSLLQWVKDNIRGLKLEASP